MNVVLFEDEKFINFLPLVYFRPVWELRCGALMIEAKIQRAFGKKFYYHPRGYLQNNQLIRDRLFSNLDADDAVLYLNSRWFLNSSDKLLLDALAQGKALVHREDVLAFKTNVGAAARILTEHIIDSKKVRETFETVNYPVDAKDKTPKVMHYLWDLVLQNGAEIVGDYAHHKNKGNISGKISEGVHFAGPREQVCIEADAVLSPGVVIDAENGPVWIDQGAKIMANSVIEGPAYIGKKSIVKIAAKIYENTTVGPVCKVGGEVEESIIHSYSNKQHDGFLGHAYLGSWVNLGADTNNSDLKNNYGKIKVFLNGRPVNTGARFVGLMMGDHSKTAINAMFNTGAVVGVCCNIFGNGMPPKFVPSFSWGGVDSITEYKFEKALEVAKVVMSRRNVNFSHEYRQVFDAVHRLAKNVEEGSPICI